MCKYLLFCILFLCCARPIYAVSVSILTSPASVGEEKFSFTVKVVGASAGTNFLRADLYREGSKNYFGETDNGQAWYFGSDGKQYFPVTVVSGIDSIATLSARIGDPTITDYPGPGQYQLRVRRYTASGNQGSEDPSPVAIILTKTWPSPSPSLSPTPTPTPSVSPTVVPTATPTTTPTPTPTPTVKSSPKPSMMPSPSLTPDVMGTVAGEATSIDLSAFGASSSSPSVASSDKPRPILNYRRVKVVLLSGTGLLIFSLVLFLIWRRQNKSKDDSLL